ncbi:MAG: BlaI/MecI/CopY family transcriptional regulator [Phycisphaerales bacterium]|nr:BlaI/MecI/CopY family transcriptional regulator [Phycisphaerales bacterium]
MDRAFEDLGELQRATLEVLWKIGPATVQQVRDGLRRGDELAYTTVLTVLQKLEKLGWVTRQREGRGHRYAAARTRTQENARSLSRFVEDVFGGDRLQLFQHLLDHQPLSNEERARLREMIARAKKESDRA